MSRAIGVVLVGSVGSDLGAHGLRVIAFEGRPVRNGGAARLYWIEPTSNSMPS